MIGWHLARLVHEADHELTHSTLESVRYARESARILFTFGSQRGKRLVVIGVQGSRPTLYWVHRKADLPDAASYDPSERFNRLRNAHLMRVGLPRADRLIRLDFERIRDTEETLKYQLWIGWLGGAGNIWLVDADSGLLLEALRKTQSVSLNAPFELPSPPSLIDWRTVSFPEYLREREGDPKQPLAEFARKRLWGIDAAFAQMIGDGWDRHQERDPSAPALRERWNEFSALMRQLRAAVNSDTPVCVSETGSGKSVVLPCDPDEIDAKSFPSLALALARTDKEIAKTEDRESRLADATSELKSRIAQLNRRLKTIEKAIADGERADAVKHDGDLLGANRHLLRKGAREVTVTDWQTGEARVIELDPAISAQENIEGFYQRARKLARGAETARSQREGILAELASDVATLGHLETGDVEPKDLPGVSTGTGAGAQGKAQQTKRLPYREFTVGKYTILVGKSRKDNDELTLHVARPYDLFFHADRVGGSHVILRQPEKGREFPADVMAVAARAAAYFSKAKHSSVVPVIFTEVRYVTKPRKSPAGLVRVTNEKSLMVEPAPPPGYHDGQTAE